MSTPVSICVFCGSRPGVNPAYMQSAKDMGDVIAKNNWRLVFGAGEVGMMGAVGEASKGSTAQTMGIIPTHLLGYETNKPIAGNNIITDDMHSRKKLMFVNSDAAVILPGGAGSLDEFFEILTWAQIGVHEQPIILVNIAGYWDPLLSLIDHVIAEGFAGDRLKTKFQVCASVAEAETTLVSALKADTE